VAKQATARRRTDCTQHSSSWDANNSFARLYTPRTVCSTNVHYSLHNSPPFFRILSSINPVHASYRIWLRFISILSPHACPRLSNRFFPSVLLSNALGTSSLPHTYYTPRQSQPPKFDHPSNMWWSVQTMKLLTVHSSHLGQTAACRPATRCTADHPRKLRSLFLILQCCKCCWIGPDASKHSENAT
jgi:hypothetical protein